MGDRGEGNRDGNPAHGPQPYLELLQWEEWGGDLGKDSQHCLGSYKNVHTSVYASKAGHVESSQLSLWLISTSLCYFGIGSFYEDKASLMFTILSDSRVLE